MLFVIVIISKTQNFCQFIKSSVLVYILLNISPFLIFKKRKDIDVSILFYVFLFYVFLFYVFLFMFFFLCFSFLFFFFLCFSFLCFLFFIFLDYKRGEMFTTYSSVSNKYSMVSCLLLFISIQYSSIVNVPFWLKVDIK